jgi:hypothetical protein
MITGDRKNSLQSDFGRTGGSRENVSNGRIKAESGTKTNDHLTRSQEQCSYGKQLAKAAEHSSRSAKTARIAIRRTGFRN